MANIRRSELPEQDYREIWRYIANDNPDAADRLLRRIDSKHQFYASFPGMGTRREAFAPGLRSFPVGNYLVFYRVTEGGIELARVLHGMRDLADLFKK